MQVRRDSGCHRTKGQEEQTAGGSAFGTLLPPQAGLCPLTLSPEGSRGLAECLPDQLEQQNVLFLLRTPLCVTG